jgi:hypothetical protein
MFSTKMRLSSIVRRRLVRDGQHGFGKRPRGKPFRARAISLCLGHHRIHSRYGYGNGRGLNVSLTFGCPLSPELAPWASNHNELLRKYLPRRSEEVTWVTSYPRKRVSRLIGWGTNLDSRVRGNDESREGPCEGVPPFSSSVGERKLMDHSLVVYVLHGHPCGSRVFEKFESRAVN